MWRDSVLSQKGQGMLHADPGISKALVAQQTIPHKLVFQTDDLDAYDSDCDDLSLAKADVQEMQYSEQTHVDDFQDNEIHSGSNIIPYSQYLQESQDARIQPTLYDGSVIAKEHAVNSVIDDEETLILEEESRSKMLDKQNDPISIEKKIKISPIDYSKLNKIKEDFAPSDLPKVSLVNESLKKLKYQLANFDKVVKKRLTSDAITAGSWGFEHTKECFVTEIIPFLKVLKDTFNAFDKTLLDEITEVQTVFNQMEAAVDQCSVDKNVFEIQIKQLRIDNDQLLNQIMSQEIMHIVANSVDILDVKKSCVNDCSKCLELETELLKKKDFIEKEAYDKLVKSYSTLEKHCISLELATQLNQEIFQRENSGENLNALTFNQLFEINELKAQSQEKDTIIRKLKERIKSLSGKDSVENIKKDIDEIETINIELEHSVAKLLSENENLRKEREHLKSIYKDQFDSIRKTRIQSKEHCDSLIAKINAKSVENSDLNAQLQERVFAITTLKNELRKLKGLNVVNTAISKPNATIAPGMFKLDIEPISPRLKNNRDAHEVYIEKTIEYTDTLCGFVESARTQNPSEPLLEYACMFTKHVQELLVYVSQTCPSSPKPSWKLVAVTPMNKDKRVRFAEPVISSSNIPNQTDSLKPKDSNKPLLTSTGVKPTTSASGSKPSGNTKNNKITRPPSSNQKNKVKDHYRKVKSNLNKTNSVSEPIINALVKHSVRIAKFESICAICNKCLFDANHDMCLIDFVNDVNVRSKSKSKRNKTRKAWKPTVKVFTNVGYKWKPTGRFFTIVGNSCPLTRNTPKKIVHLKKTTSKSVETLKPEIKVYSRRPKQIKPGSNATDVPSSSSLVNDRLSRSFSGSRDTNLYTISLDDMLKTSPISLLSKASKTKRWLWHLNFGTLNKQSKDGLVRAARTMLISSKAPLFLWADSINTTCYTQNRSLIRLRYNKTPYELMHDKKPDLLFFHIFGSLCYPTNDSEDLGKLNAKADIGIFVSYAPAKKAFRIYNRRTRKFMETIHVTFDEPITIASEQFDAGPGLQVMTTTTSCSGLIPNINPQQPCNPQNIDDWDSLFQPLFDEYFNPPTIGVSPVPVVVAPRAVDIADSPVSMSIDQDAPSSSIPSTQDQEHSLIISQSVEESPKIPIFHDDPLYEFLQEDSTFQVSSSNMRASHTLFELIGRWTKDHPIANVIGDPSRLVSTRKQRKTDITWSNCRQTNDICVLSLMDVQKKRGFLDLGELTTEEFIMFNKPDGFVASGITIACVQAQKRPFTVSKTSHCVAWYTTLLSKFSHFAHIDSPQVQIDLISLHMESGKNYCWDTNYVMILIFASINTTLRVMGLAKIHMTTKVPRMSMMEEMSFFLGF
ncbi:retrovirus-related pol polyprotein from transposon TNT 1-94 [Tanacetum coccineum]